MTTDLERDIVRILHDQRSPVEAFQHPVMRRMAELLWEWDARLSNADNYARWVNREQAAGMRVGGLSRRERLRLVIALWRMP